MGTKERKVLNKGLSVILRMDWRIKFVGMVDRNGKLLVGRSKDIPLSCLNYRHTDITRTSTHIVNSKIDDLKWVIGNCIAHLDNQEVRFGPCVPMNINEVSSYFKILGCSNGDVKLAITPLNVIRKTFLCIYFEPAYNVRNSNVSEEGLEELLNRISSSIL
jgi:hypothetical protein